MKYIPYSDITKYYSLLNKELVFYTIIIILPIFRKTIFNVAVDAGTYSGGLNQSTSLALLSVGVTFFIFLSRYKEIIMVCRKVLPLLLYYIFCLLSFIYSEQKFAIIFKATEVLSSIVLTSYIIHKIKNVKLCLSYILLICLLPMTIEFIYAGGRFIHTNTYSFSALLGLLICIGGIRYNIFRWKEVGIFIIIFILGIIGGTSSATYISTIVGILTYFVCNKKGVKIEQIVLVCIIAFLIYYLYSDLILKYVFYGKSMGAVEGGTGRFGAWTIYMERFKESPIWGYGFLVGERMASTKFGIEIPLISAHNSFISVLIGTGSIGMIFFLLFLIKWFYKLYTKAVNRNVFGLILLPVFIAFIINTNSFPAIGSDWNYVGLALYAIYAFTQTKM